MNHRGEVFLPTTSYYHEQNCAKAFALGGVCDCVSEAFGGSVIPWRNPERQMQIGRHHMHERTTLRSMSKPLSTMQTKRSCVRGYAYVQNKPPYKCVNHVCRQKLARGVQFPAH